MCGISGIIAEKEMDVASLLAKMSNSQQIRGQDSFGIALFNKYKGYKVVASCKKSDIEMIKRIADDTHQISIDENNVILECIIDIKKRNEFINKLKEVKALILSHGNSLSIIKDVGLVKELYGKWDIDKNAKHGLSHVRIATGSNVTQANAHPFCCMNVGDIAVVHNGEVTNAAKLKEELSFKGYEFLSETDTEVIVAFIANRIAKGKSLKDACNEFISEASGYYSCIISTKSEVAFFKDIAATRPALFGYHEEDKLPGYYAIATDISCLAAVGATKGIQSVGPGEVKIFSTGTSYTPERLYL